MNGKYLSYLMSFGCLAAAGAIAQENAVTPAPATQPTAGSTIQVTRDVGTMGKLCLGEISVDGRVVAELDQGQSASVAVSAGPHTLRGAPALNSWLCKRFYSSPQMQQTQVALDVSPGATVAYRYGFSASGVPVLTAAGN